MENQEHSSGEAELFPRPALSGRELDAAVAERVFGFAVKRETYTQGFDYVLEFGHTSIPPYSTNITAAMEVVKHLLVAFSFSCACGSGGGIWQVAFLNMERAMRGDAQSNSDGLALTLPLAICRAALAAVARDEPKQEMESEQSRTKGGTHEEGADIKHYGIILFQAAMLLALIVTMALVVDWCMNLVFKIAELNA